MNWLFESPITILIGSLIIGFFLGVAWVQTGRNALLYSLGGLVLATVLLLVLERNIETDGEKVTRLIHQIAAKIEANDAEAVVEHIISSQPEMKDRGRSEMSRHTFSDVTITKVHQVSEYPDRQPPQVVIEFNVSVSGSFENNAVSLAGRPVYFRVTFWKDLDGEWRIGTYEYDADQPYPRASGKLD